LLSLKLARSVDISNNLVSSQTIKENNSKKTSKKLAKEFTERNVNYKRVKFENICQENTMKRARGGI